MVHAAPLTSLAYKRVSAGRKRCSVGCGMCVCVASACSGCTDICVNFQECGIQHNRLQDYYRRLLLTVMRAGHLSAVAGPGVTWGGDVRPGERA
jgi:hypothetical protein